ncbi:MAG: hypothetical protein LAQ30_24425 [Acidobacteriia bacterium]|nr:hypothetical protein [Terriglobia bacterium]
MWLLKPVVALRVLTLSSTILLVSAIFLPKASFAAGFVVGLALVFGIAVQKIVWNSSLHWSEKPERGETIQMNLAQPQR